MVNRDMVLFFIWKTRICVEVAKIVLFEIESIWWGTWHTFCLSNWVNFVLTQYLDIWESFEHYLCGVDIRVIFIDWDVIYCERGK